MDDIVDVEDQPSIEDIAKQMYEDFERITGEGYEWNGGTIRPWDYESQEQVETALENYAPLTGTEEIEATFRNEDTRASAEFTYDVRHLRLEETQELLTE